MKRKSLIAMAIMVSGLSVSSQSVASWGCEVLLCLSDPRGPTTEGECKPPIKKLWRELAKGKGFPSCAMAGNSDNGTGSFAKQVRDYYDPCPDGTEPVEGYIAQSDSNDRRDWYRLSYSYSKNYDGRWNNGMGGFGDRPTARACASGPQGAFRDGHKDDRKTVHVYSQVVWQQPQNPRAIDVYIDGQLHKRVRW
ncbi:hypothetical protein BKG02_004781 [Vibrio parahaemolyticus]|uniref:hypothetical protein n=1 Tax=Vibrio parahaemolyticus TaxID=670 RepID=UPI00287AE224|nr:hypothetical protein [Vibrio parahaemolyticus]EJE4644428.1 hypothetical protein [Vibrio parahaemolyticus]MDS1925671.1 hypothetical protein [Vibrio parahaemolyticus]